jgi:hypothetical protein
MSMRLLNLILLLPMLLFLNETYAQQDIKAWIVQHGLSTDYPILSSVVLSGSVSYTRASGFYYYNYTLTNAKGNTGNIWMFEIDIRRHPGSISYDTVGLKFADDFEQGQFRRDYAQAGNAVEPVSFLSLPDLDWVGDIAHNSVANFGVDTLSPTPGSTVRGFTIMSKALPGMRAFTAYSDFDEGKYQPDIDGDTTAALDSIYNAVYSYLDSMTANINYRGWTIGPTAPPLDFSATSWIDTLASYKHQCVALGWLTNGPEHEKDEDDDKADEGIVERLDHRLDKAKAALVKTDSVKAKQELELFVKEVEQLYHKNKEEGKRRGVPALTSEGYALLKYNAEYLIDKLPGRHGRGEDQKGKIER